MRAIKDEDAAHPIATDWRPVFETIVRAFVRRDYALTSAIPSVEPVTPELATHIASAIADYGETLVELPAETWTTSCAQWIGPHWNVLVDLWTAESGASDLVLETRVFESTGRYRFEVQFVYVP